MEKVFSNLHILIIITDMKDNTKMINLMDKANTKIKAKSVTVIKAYLKMAYLHYILINSKYL